MTLHQPRLRPGRGRSALRRLGALALIAIGLCLASSAQAQTNEPSPEEAAALAEARAKFQEATELERAQNWSEALRLFREVGQVRMTPQVRYHIAHCQEQLGRLVAALGGYELALEDAAAVGDSFEQEIQIAVERLRGSIPRLVIELGENTASATVQLDGVVLGAASIGSDMPVDPGAHRISAQAPGYEPFEAVVELRERQTETVLVSLESPAPAPVRQAPPQLEPQEEASMTLPLVVGGVGVAGLITGGVLWALRQRNLSRLEEDCPDLDCSDSPNRVVSQRQFDRSKTYNWTSQVALGVGVGAAAALYFLDRPAEADERRAWSLGAGPAQASVGVSVAHSF